jgi:hypothetical protein
MDKENLQKYAELKAQIKELEAQVEELKPGIVEYMLLAEAEKIELTGYGNFTLEKRRTWTFSPEVESFRAELKVAEGKEKAEGKASYNEVPVLKYNESK